MKVLFVSNDPTLFDAASPARERLRGYAARIGELHVLSRGPRTAADSQDGQLYLHPIHGSKLLSFGRLRRRARALIEERAIEVVSAQDPFEHGLAAAAAVRGTSARLHIQVHTDFLSPWFVRSGNLRSPQVRMPFLNRFRVRWAARVLPQAAGIRVVSGRIKESLVARYGSRIPEPSVIPVAVPRALPQAAPLPPHPFKFALMAIGRLEPEKRIEDIFAALKLLVARYPSLGLVIAGDGRERRRLERKARRLGIGEKVVFLGNRPDAWSLLQSAQAFVQASAYEGYGRTLVEAALAKVPIITTDVGIVGEVFKGYEDLLSVPVGDPTAFSYAIAGLMEDVSAREMYVRSAEQTARTHLDALQDQPGMIAADLVKTLGHS